MKASWRSLAYAFLSWAVVAFGQPAWNPWLAPVAACIGYALFWRVAAEIPSSKQRFWWGTLWFSAVQVVQLSWMTSIEFHGIYILIVYALLLLWLGVQFGLVTLFLDRIPMMATAACWTLLEWARLYVLCGFSWNPVGLTLTAFSISMQAASLFGILGLSFLVFLTNLAFWKKRWTAFVALALFPYAFGAVQLSLHRSKIEQSSSMTVGLVQTGLLPSQKLLIDGRVEEFISPSEQWRRILALLKDCRQPLDLVVLPEFSVPFSAEHQAYSLPAVRRIFEEMLEPTLLQPLVQLQSGSRVSNQFWVRAISKIFKTDVIAGLEAEEEGHHFSSAFYCTHHQDKVERYDKQVLVPLAEYIPFSWVKILTQPYGITEFFTHGREAKVFSAKIPLSASICYEETFAHLMRQNRVKGSAMFVNLTNDNWYPGSRLPQQHFDHARVRAVENGVPLVRACNTGITAAIDCLGRTLGQITDERRADLLVARVPLYHFSTPYSFWGDWGIIGLCILFLGICFYLTKAQIRYFQL